MEEITIDPRIKAITTEEEQELLVLMWTAVARKDIEEKALDDMFNCGRNGSRAFKLQECNFQDAKDDLKKQRSITLGKIYYSNNKLWKYLTSPFKDAELLEEGS